MTLFCRLGRMSLLLPLLLATACSVYSVPGDQPAPVEEPPPVATGEPEAPPQTPVNTGTAGGEDHGDAYRSLLARADQAVDQGDYDQALSLLERAHRLDPDSGEIYLEMARAHCARGDYGQCRAVAERGLLYCQGRRQCAALRKLSSG